MIRFYAVCVIAAFWFFGAGYFWVQYHDISTSALYVVAGLILPSMQNAKSIRARRQKKHREERKAERNRGYKRGI